MGPLELEVIHLAPEVVLRREYKRSFYKAKILVN